MTKIYLVNGISGEYEDYYQYIIKAFFDEDKAEEYKNRYNEELKLNKKIACSRRERGLEYDTWIGEEHEASIEEIEVE